jgi:hypothetical protein
LLVAAAENEHASAPLMAWLLGVSKISSTLLPCSLSLLHRKNSYVLCCCFLAPGSARLNLGPPVSFSTSISTTTDGKSYTPGKAPRR